MLTVSVILISSSSFSGQIFDPIANFVLIVNFFHYGRSQIFYQHAYYVISYCLLVKFKLSGFQAFSQGNVAQHKLLLKRTSLLSTYLGMQKT